LTASHHINPIPAASVGVGLKPAHYRDVLFPPKNDSDRAGDLAYQFDFFEVHAENYMCDGGPAHAWLNAIREHYSLSIHGVCLSLGGFNNLDTDHLQRLRIVVDRFQPALVSEHIAWCAHDGVFYNDLLAPPLTQTTLARTAEHIDQTQTALGRRILIENPSSYLKLPGDMSEPDFLNALARKTGCGLLLDINNIYVSACNLKFDAITYLDAIDHALVEEIHLAGHAVDTNRGVEIRVDDHGSPVCDDVGALYRRFIRSAGAHPTLVEWDTDTPPLKTLSEEAAKTAAWMKAAQSETAPPKQTTQLENA
jgi:uncharacterized protein